RHEPVALEIARAADHYGGPLGIELDDIQGSPHGEAEPLLLPDGVAGDAAVRPEHPPLEVDNGAGAEHAGLTAAQEAAVVVVRDEADLLALGLVRRHQPEAPRMAPHLVLRQLADGKARRLELRLRQRPEE